jgi:RNA recognition motif-containing protein
MAERAPEPDTNGFLVQRCAQCNTHPEEKRKMGTRLYVGNLPYGTTEDELTDLFSQMGEVANVAIIMDRETGRSKGFGFVEMTEASAAIPAVEKLNGTQMGGRTIRVAEANARPPRAPRPGGSDRDQY